MSPVLETKEKLMLLELADYSKNVSAACEYMGISRKTYYQIKKAHDEGGLEALAGKSRKVPNVRNRVPEHIEQAVLRLSREDPLLGKKKISRILKERGLQISPNGVMNVWGRYGLKTKEERMTESQRASRPHE
jgi:transposase